MQKFLHVPGNFLSDVGKGGKIVRCCLVYKIVQPVGKQQAGVAAPTVEDFLLGIVVFEVMLGNFDRKIFIYVAEIFAGQGFPVIFRVASDEKLTSGFAGNQVSAGFL